MHERILLLPSTRESRGRFLNLLGDICVQQWQASQVIDQLNQAVCAYTDAVRDGWADAGSLEDLGIALLYRVQELDDPGDLTQCVSVMEQVVHLTPDDHPDRSRLLSNFGNALFRRFECLSDLGDLNKSVLIQEDAIRLTPDSHRDKPLRLHNLSTCLLGRFEHLGDLSDLNESVSMGDYAVRLTLDGHPDKPRWLNNLANSLAVRFDRLGDLADLDKSVLTGEHAVHLTSDVHPEKTSWLQDLRLSLLRRFECLGDIGDLDKLVLLQEDAVSRIPDSHPDKPPMLNNLGSSLYTRFEQLGNLGDLNKCLLVRAQAVSLTPDGHTDKPLRLSNLGNSFARRFEHLGNLDDLNKSVQIFEDAVQLTPDGHSTKPSALNNLGTSLHIRFEHLGDLGDLKKSISIREDALRLIPDGHPDKPSRLNSLGGSLLRRFERLGDMDDINKSVLLREEAVHLSPDGHLDKAMRLHNLGNSLLTRFECRGNPNDLDKAILMEENALSLTPDSHPDKPAFLNTLSGSLYRRFETVGNLDDLNRSVLMQEKAVSLTPRGHPNGPIRLNNLGNALSLRYERLGDNADMEEAIAQYKSAACSTTGAAQMRFMAASMWARCAKIVGHPSLLEAYHVALDLLPELAWLGLSISDRHYHLLRAGKVVRDAAAAAIASGEVKKAVEWLEQGRSVIWGQLLNLRTPVDTLKDSHPKLANQLLSLSAQLEGSGTRMNDGEINESVPRQSLQSIADLAHQNAREREELLKQIRGLVGFSRFLLPKTISELSPAAQNGPVVMLNITDERCDALILMPCPEGKVKHISLDDFTPTSAASLAKSFRDLVRHPGSGGVTGRLVGVREGCQNPEDEFARGLSELWLGVARPVLDALAITTKSNIQRIWWCPTCPLAFLPIHAAGLYGKDDTFGSKLSDFMISSYTPSLTALIEGFRPHFESHNTQQLLAVAHPGGPGRNHIPGTKEEITHIQRLLMESLQFCDWMNIWQHWRMLRETATGDTNLAEESVHLAAGMLLAGYRGIIATMWTIRDDDAPKVASDVYEHLFKVSPPDSTHAAEALHLAIGKLRERSGGKKSFFHWVPFIHVVLDGNMEVRGRQNSTPW
ncbi:TPR-like protein [Mycena leptocephala]|nr:TPR-like protein [Mycena leptocephala]